MMEDTPANYGIHQTGGTMTIGTAAVGSGARATVNNAAPALAAAGHDDLTARLNALLDAIEAHGALLPDKPTAEELVRRIATEAASKTPDKLTLKSFLATLADQVKSVSLIAGSVTALAATVGKLI